MSGVAVIVSLLKASTPITTIVPAARIMAGDAPIDTPRPLILVTEPSSNKFFRTISANERPVTRIERVQVSVLVNGPAATTAGLGYPQVKSLLRLISNACPGQSGTINGFMVYAITDEGENPDLSNAEVGLYSQSVDFFVTWVDP